VSEQNDALLRVDDLAVRFERDEAEVRAVNGVSFAIGRREVLGVVGESGCGKSVTGFSIMGLVPSQGGRISGGSITFRRDGGQTVELTALAPAGEEIRSIRGREIGMIFQEPMRTLSPVYSIGELIGEGVRAHLGVNRKQSRELAVELLRRVHIADPEERVDSFPHQLSGGMRQRVMIAIALSCNPSLLIADEPTTALDVTVQAQILDLMEHLQEQFGMAILYITHDLGVIAEIADEVAVMYLGRVVEHAVTRELFRNPLHPYTRLLLKSIPRMGKDAKQRLEAIEGTVPIPLDPPRMCGFYSRCPDAIAGTCDMEVPGLVEVSPGHSVRCYLHSPQTEPIPETPEQPRRALGAAR
jgi:peptide/nickel transport system ATP-binding protein